jgi:hypothetical protein
MESFLSTLLGAFLGVSLPFVISAIIERINFKKFLNTVFVQYETYSQHCRVMASRIVGEAAGSWSKFQKESRKTLTMNFESSVDCSDLLLAQYSKFLWTCPDFVDTLLCYGLAQRILFVLSRRSVAQVRV